MSLIKILPSVIVVLIIQLFLLVNSIKKIVSDKKMNKERKALWILFILFIPVFGIIIFNFTSGSNSYNKVIKDFDEDFDNNLQYSIFLGLLYAFAFLMFVIIYINSFNILITIFLSVTIILLFILHTLKNKMTKSIKYILPYILTLTLTVAEYISISQEYGFIILISLGIIIIEYPLKYSRIFLTFPLVIFLVGSLIKLYTQQTSIPENYLIEFVMTNSLTYLFVAGGFYIAKRQLVMNNYLNYLMKELKVKNQELEEASILRERNRIAREIHDTLGHTLTGAIIQLEVAKQMIETSPEKAKESIEKTQKITRHGFNEVKEAINTLRPVTIEENTLKDGLKLLFERSQKYFNYSIETDIDLPDEIYADLKVTVYRLIQELITNSIRHGDAKKMKINISYQFNTLRINCFDDGKGCPSIKEGNGLAGIRDRVAKQGGHVEFSSQVNEGFGAIIYINI